MRMVLEKIDLGKLRKNGVERNWDYSLQTSVFTNQGSIWGYDETLWSVAVWFPKRKNQICVGQVQDYEGGFQGL